MGVGFVAKNGGDISGLTLTECLRVKCGQMYTGSQLLWFTEGQIILSSSACYMTN